MPKQSGHIAIFFRISKFSVPKNQCLLMFNSKLIKKINWSTCIVHGAIDTEDEHFKKIVHDFETHYAQIMVCLVSLTFCNVLVRTLGKQHVNY